MYVVCQDRERWSNLSAIAVDEVAQCREGNICAANRASQERHFKRTCGRHFKFVEDISNAKEIKQDIVISVMYTVRH